MMLSRWTAVHDEKMQTALHLLLLLIPYGGYAGGPSFTTETKAVGESVSLICPYSKDNSRITLFWIRLNSGTFPEFLAQSQDFQQTYNWTSSIGHHIIAKLEAGTFVLQISQVQKSDMAIYYCFKWRPYVRDSIFLKGIFLQVKDFPEADTSDITVTQDLRTDGSLSGPSVTSQCSVLPRSENQTCFDGHKVYWFRAKTNDTRPSFIYTRGVCEKITGGSVRKCVHGFSKNISSSNARNYLCAVVTCGEIFTESAKNIIPEDACRCDFQRSINVALGAALALSFILLVFLLYNLKTKQCFCCMAGPQTRGKTSNFVQEREGDSLVYSAPTIVARKSGKLKQTSLVLPNTHTCDSQRVPTYVLGAILTFSLLLSAFFVYKIKTKRCSNCKVCPQSLDEAPNQVQQRNEDSLVYSAPIIVSRKRGKLKQADGEFSTYTDVCLRKL